MVHKNGNKKHKNRKLKKQYTKMEQNNTNQEPNLAEENTAETANNAENTNNTDNNVAENVTENNNLSDEQQPTEKNQQEEDFKQKYEELNDRHLRLMAEFDNYRKRTLKEKMDLTKYAEEDVLKGILQVVDNMERAIKSMSTATDMDAVREGINLIYKKFTSFLESRGLKEVEALNQELNTDLHEAVAKFTAPSEDLKGKIIDVVEKGYYLHDKVIRYAKVVIGE